MGSSVYSTPVPANGALYISNRNQLYALSEGAGAAKPDTTSGTAAQPATTPATRQIARLRATRNRLPLRRRNLRVRRRKTRPNEQL